MGLIDAPAALGCFARLGEGVRRVVEVVTSAALSATDRIVLATAAGFSRGPLTVEPALRRVVHTDGREEILQPRVMQVLVALARVDGAILSRDTLQETCWNGVIVGEDALSRAIGQLRRLCEGLAAGVWRLETITKVGYRLLRIDGGEAASQAATRAPAPDKPSIMVLPFTNLSNDPTQNYFADGMVEEIVTALSRFRSLFVIASASSLALRGLATDPIDAARELSVRYVLEGSVRRVGERVRIIVRLIDCRDSGQIWAERFEDSLVDVFALQDRVALSVAGVIEPAMHAAEIQRVSRRPTENMGSYDLYLRAYPLFLAWQKSTVFEALTFVERALALDPNFAAALTVAAACHRQIAENRWDEPVDEHKREAIALARRALAAAPDDAFVLAQNAMTLANLLKDTAQGRLLLDRAIEINPGSAFVWFISGLLHMSAGEPGLIVEHMEIAARLDPLSATGAQARKYIAVARFQQGRFEEALVLFKPLGEKTASDNAILAAIHGHLGQGAQAREAIAGYQAITSVPIDRSFGWFRRPEHRALFRRGIALAQGLDPELG